MNVEFIFWTLFFIILPVITHHFQAVNANPEWSAIPYRNKEQQTFETMKYELEAAKMRNTIKRQQQFSRFKRNDMQDTDNTFKTMKYELEAAKIRNTIKRQQQFSRFKRNDMQDIDNSKQKPKVPDFQDCIKDIAGNIHACIKSEAKENRNAEALAMEVHANWTLAATLKVKGLENNITILTNEANSKVKGLENNISILTKEAKDNITILTNELNTLREKCQLLELILGVRRELEESENEFWEMLNFPITKDRFWKWIMSLKLLNTPEVKKWNALLEKNKMSIVMFAKYASSLYDVFSKRDHRDVLIPRECISIEVVNKLLKDGTLNCLSVEQRHVITMAVEMRAYREDRANWPINNASSSLTETIISNHDDFRCVLLTQVEMSESKSTTLPPVDNQDGTAVSTTQRKPVTSFPRPLPSQHIRNVYFPSKIAQKSTEFMCELEESYNAQKPTGTILVRFSTVNIAAAAIFTRQIPRTVGLEMVNCDKYQPKCSENKITITEHKNVKSPK